jgi:hypothetical protein
MGFGGSTISSSENKIGALSIQSSTYGLPLNLVWGTTRVTGNMIGYSDFVAIPHTQTQSSGGKGGGVTSSNTTYTYQCAAMFALGEGVISGIGTIWSGKDKTTLSALGLSLFTGAPGQTPWSFMVSNHPTQALAYPAVAYVANSAFSLGTSASLPNLSYEVQGPRQFGGGIVDAMPDLILSDFLTNSVYGAGFPSAKLGDLTAYKTYTQAMGLFLSPALTQQQQASQTVTDLMTMTNSDVVWSQGVLKIVPYGDTAVTGNGVTYTPNIVPVYDLTDDDFLGDTASDPITIKRKTQADAYNHVQIEFMDRAADYNLAIAEATDLANIDMYGRRTQQPITMHAICDRAVADKVSSTVLQRALYIRNTYEFKLGWRFCLLEPMDIVTLTHSLLGLNLLQVRITDVEENENGELSIIAEEFPFGVAHPPQITTQVTSGYSVDANAAPSGIATPLFFEAPIEKTSVTGLGIYAAVSGLDSTWGGANVWVSLDGSTYKKIATINGGARYGRLTAAMAAASAGSDNVNIVAVALSGTGGQLLSGTTDDATLLNTLCYVDGEYLSYVTSTLTATNSYTLSNLIRGAYTTATPAHASGAAFARVDDTLPMVEIDPSYIGKQIWFKFTSFNQYQSGETDLSTATAYAYTVTGAMLKLPPAPVDSFLVTVQADGTRQYSWSYNNGAPADVTSGGGYRIKYYLGTTTDWTVMTDAHPTGLITYSPFESNQLAAGTYTFAIKAVDSLGNESATANFLTVTLTDPSLGNVLVQRQERELFWPGTITGGFVYNSSIYAKSSSTIASLPSAISSLASTIDNVGTNTSPITYVTPVIDLGVDTSFNPLVTPAGNGTFTITMKVGATANGGVTGSFVPLTNVAGKRYIQIQVSVAGTAPRLDEITTLLDGTTQEDDFNNVNTATETSVWFYRVGTGNFRIGSKSGLIAAISTAQIVALQNTGGAWTWELVNKTSTVNGQPAAEFKIRNASGVLADALIDVSLIGAKI